jgi:hypothetical protein
MSTDNDAIGPSLEHRTSEIVFQLTRYGFSVVDEDLLDVLDVIVRINDDMAHVRSPELIRASCLTAAEMLTAMAANQAAWWAEDESAPP